MKGLSRERGLEGRQLPEQVREEWLTEGRAAVTNATLKLPLSERAISLGWAHQIYLWMPGLQPNCSGREDRQTHFQSSIGWPVLYS